MEMVPVIEDMTSGLLLDHVADLAATQRRCEVDIVRAAVQHAYLHHAQTLDPDQASRPGGERARRLGGPGTPEVTEFAAAELAGRLGCSTVSAGLLMADGLDICHRLPRLWAGVQAGRVRVYLARLVARRTRQLTLGQADDVDARVAAYADGRLSYTRFQQLLEGAVVAADLVAARAREDQAARAQWARPTRPAMADPGAEESEHGMRGFTIRAPFPVIAVFDAALARIAAILADLGDPDPVDQRRVKALLVLARPDLASRLVAAYTAWADRPEDATSRPPTGPKPQVPWDRLLPRVVVNVHTYADPDINPQTTPHPDRVARVERCGAVTTSWVARHLTTAAKVTVVPVLDVEGLAPVDAYEIPERHRRAVRLMTPADTFPYATSLHPDQIDHTHPYTHSPSGQTSQSRIGNYGPMTTYHHRVKTHGRWRVEQPFPGIYLWQDPHGQTYLVDHTGSRTLGRSRRPDAAGVGVAVAANGSKWAR